MLVESRLETATGYDPYHTSPFALLRTLHEQSGSFTRVCNLGEAVIGLSSRTEGPEVNNTLLGGIPDPDVFEFTERFFWENGRYPAYYFPVTPETARLHEYLVMRGYRYAWEDAWMRLRLDYESQENPSRTIKRRARTDRELDDVNWILRESHAEPASQYNPYGAYDKRGLYTEHIALKSLLRPDRTSITQVLVVDVLDPFQAPAATATVTSVGEIAYISRVARRPKFAGGRLGMAAVRAAIDSCDQARHVAEMLNIEPIICLATASGFRPQGLFKDVGFSDDFYGYGYVHNSATEYFKDIGR